MIFCRSVANELKQGHQISPETFSQATIYFSDIVGFTSLASDSTPIQIVNMLNRLYSTFDDITDKYDVYKVREPCTTNFKIWECKHILSSNFKIFCHLRWRQSVMRTWWFRVYL